MGIDFSSEFGQKALKQLQDEHVVWLTTVGASSNTPQPNVIWFLYQDGDVIMYTQPGYQRLKNIARNPRVSLNFNSPEDGEAMTIFTGTAEIDNNIKPVAQNPEYVEKYARWMELIDTTPEKMSAEYTVAIRIRLDKLRGW